MYDIWLNDVWTISTSYRRLFWKPWLGPETFQAHNPKVPKACFINFYLLIPPKATCNISMGTRTPWLSKRCQRRFVGCSIFWWRGLVGGNKVPKSFRKLKRTNLNTPDWIGSKQESSMATLLYFGSPHVWSSSVSCTAVFSGVYGSPLR